MKKIVFVISLVLVAGVKAQVGINTPSPTNMLDVNGDLNINKELRTGGTDVLKGSAGTAGDILHNNSTLTANDWKTIKIADGQGSMSVFSINTVADNTGITFSGNNGLTNPYSDGEALGTNWTVLPQATDSFSVTNGTNKATFSFQTTVQKTGTNSATFACGIFIDNKLRAVRTDVLLGDTGAYKIFNLNATLTNLNPQNKYTVKVACTKRAISGTTLGIGRAVDATYLNSDMSQSVLTTSVLQPY
ncbi:hypothetical protein LF887_01120 [Chryseobacterium sp. MEBOG06]|uniref:hypothetical protein n=1 Tax=Chryseobacterium sp. MEBOG06 TaxID=2879938 RepID=UPI001F19791D|nr:hypothetical protein [Chryseobacterium sp. MEBOG06]UKB84282.1 hypothetical protein LF887_01120 [Chryseobacterium sp. MEBOG06]